MPRSRGQSIKQLSRACAAHLSLTLPGPSAAHSKLIGSRHRIANPQLTNPPPTHLPNSTQCTVAGGGHKRESAFSHHRHLSVRLGPIWDRTSSFPIHRAQRGNLGWSSGGGKWGVKESFRVEAPPLRLRPYVPQSLTGL